MAAARADAMEERPTREASQRWLRRAVGSLLLLAAGGVACWVLWVYREIQHYATRDEARPADAIAVFGAAEYDGRPSPVLRARLEQGLLLYQQKLAPLIITLGGSGDPEHSEGGVGQNFLIAQGVPESSIIAETQSRTTAESARRLAVIAEANHIHSILAVSDGTHLFRIHQLCESYGLTVYTSPRAVGRPVGRWRRAQRLAHEIASYTGWTLGLR
ncbi:MAG: YdcF family protein [Acidobacteriaceae bacterium]